MLLNRLGWELKSRNGDVGRIAALARVADLGIADGLLHREDVELPDFILSELNADRPAGMPEVPQRFSFRKIRFSRKDVDTVESRALPFDEESNGTKKFVAMAMIVLEHYGLARPW